ncbi:MAG: type I DNA topoisomerase [Phycisphaerales bacterium]|nr:type I DNA topoisomerase [Phycisphaerales bacterium]
MARRTGKHLVIVESPAKAKTINRYLGDDFVVKASMGHIRDLPSKGMGVNLKTFEPEYVIIEEKGKGKIVSELKKLAKSAEDVFLATDLDREGEAIAWHLKEALEIPDDRVKRVIFNAITKSEIKKAFEKPHKLDMDRVNAQQARRVLDRIVGYEISPLLWRKVARGLSAGRVQSVAVRLIVEREREIEAFEPEEYWKIGAVFVTDRAAAPRLSTEWHAFLENTGNGPRTRAERDKWLAAHNAFTAELIEVSGRKFEKIGREEALRVASALGLIKTAEERSEDPEARGVARHLIRVIGKVGEHPAFTVRQVEKKRSQSRPPPPFITSTLQQAASSRLGFGAQRTMRAAQSLYESGRITYMRTDSTNLSDEAINMVRAFIKAEFGDKYLPESPNIYASSNKSAQEAHEAIRPTDLSFTPGDAHGRLSPDESRLYHLIYNRFVACQMPPAEFDQTTATIVAQSSGVGGQGGFECVFKATGRKLVFDGFMKITGVLSEDQLLPDLQEGTAVFPIEIDPTQHFTQPPPRFTEASLVKELERLGIGRPSTYANIISVIQERQYVVQIDRRFHATLLGKVVTDKLIQAFPEIMDVGFTADMETKLDQIEEAHTDWVKLLRDFYGPFHQDVKAALEKLEHAGGTESPYDCPTCGKKMLYRISKNGFFLACSDRKCGATQPVDVHGKPLLREVSAFKCPACGREMIRRRGRYGEFLGCSGYSIRNPEGEPVCSTIINLDKEGNPVPPKPPPIKTTIPCEKCGSPMLLRDSKRGPFLGCSAFPKCRSTKMVKKLQDDQLRQVEALLPMLKEGAARSQEAVASILQANPTLREAPSAGVKFPITTDIDCDECGKPMVIRSGRRGPFLGCSGYPKCRNTGEVPEKLLEELGLTNGEDNSPPVGSRREAVLAEHDEAA